MGLNAQLADLFSMEHLSTRTDAASGAPDGDERRRAALPLLLLSAIVVCSSILVISAVRTTSARVSASTDSSSLLSTGTIALDQDTAVDLLFDEQNLYPGRTVENCIDVTYVGSLDAELRVYGTIDGGTGLDDFVDLRLALLTDGCARSATSPLGTQHDHGSIADFVSAQPSWPESTLRIAPVGTDDVVGLWASVVVRDDNAAQGLTTDFSVIVEARAQ